MCNNQPYLSNILMSMSTNVHKVNSISNIPVNLNLLPINPLVYETIGTVMCQWLHAHGSSNCMILSLLQFYYENNVSSFRVKHANFPGHLQMNTLCIINNLYSMKYYSVFGYTLRNNREVCVTQKARKQQLCIFSNKPSKNNKGIKGENKTRKQNGCAAR